MKKKLLLMIAAFLTSSIISSGSPAHAANNIAAFPGAEGGGKFATGGRGGSVYYVTNLNDSGPGSFRDAVSRPNRIVVFKVGGTIELRSDVSVNSNITIAGQTAPGGGGITLKNYKIGLGGDNIIMRFISSRPGERRRNQDYDALGGGKGSNSIIDHCSFGWANDEQWGLYSNNINYTTQWSIVGPSNSFSYHSKGVHGFGVMLGKGNCSWHHNMIVDNVSRNFRGKVAGTYTADFVNNVLYNWAYETAYGTIGHLNYVGNYLKMGPNTKGGFNYVNVDSTTYPDNFKIFLKGNKFVDNNNNNFRSYTFNNWSGISYSSSNGRNEGNVKSNNSFTIMNNGVNLSVVNRAESADAAYNNVLTYSGAGVNSNSRPAIDKQVTNEARTGTGQLVGARPYNEANSSQRATIDKYGIKCGVAFNYPAPVTTGAPVDSDNDGMPDWWENERGLNPRNASDANGDYCNKGYTNIEYYLNDLTVNAFPQGTVTVSPKRASNNNNNNPNTGDRIDGVYYIKNVASGLYLDVENGSSNNGTNIRQWSFNGCNAQKFKLVYDGRGYYSILTGASNYASCIDVNSGSANNGTNIEQWKYTGKDMQKYVFHKTPKGQFAILTKCSDAKSCIEVYEFSPKAGANVDEWKYSCGAGQLWILERAN